MNPNTSAALVWPMILGILDDNEKGRKRLRDVLQGFADEGIVFSVRWLLPILSTTTCARADTISSLKT